MKEKSKIVGTRIPEEIYNKLDEILKEKRITKSYFLKELLTFYVSNKYLRNYLDGILIFDKIKQ